MGHFARPVEVVTQAIGTLLTRRAALDGVRCAIIDAERRWTFGELNDYANRVANALASLGVEAGDRVAVALRNGAEYCALYYGAAKLGAILCGVNWRLAPPEIAHILRHSGARVIVCGAEFASVVLQAIEGLGIDAALTVGQDTPSLQHASLRRFESVIEHASITEPKLGISPDAPLLLCYTSGTTGRPKGALLSHAQMLWSSTTIAFTVDYRYRDVNLIPTPMFHVGGLSFATLFVHRGATALLPPAWNPDQVLATVEAHRINHFFAVPTMLDSLLQSPRLVGTDLASLRWIMTGAAPLPVRLIHAFDQLGVPLLQSYGSTETAGPAACVDMDHVLAKAGSIGKAFFHSEVRVVDASGRETASGEIGEIQVRAPHVFSGYWNDEAATRAAFSDGWLVTGDLGRRDQDGYLFIVDRKKDLIISGGENVYPAEVEQVLAEHPAIAEIAIVGVPDEKWGEAVCAVLVPRSGHLVTLAELRAHCQGRIASYKLPTLLVLSAEPLPRNATGKLLKSEAKALALT